MEKTRLYVEITDNETSTSEWVVLIPFGEDEDYMKACTHNGQPCFEVLIDEGYIFTYYYYPVPRFAITNVSKYY